MPTSFSFAFFAMDPGVPPGVGTLLNPVTLTATDQNDNGILGTGQGDTIGGFTVTSVWVGDTITVRIGGVDTVITGVTFYRSGAGAVFMPTDGTVLVTSSFRSSTFVTTSTQFTLPPVPCFVAGTVIFTAKGPCRVEDLLPGDLVLTRDGGMQPLRWVGRVTVSGKGRLAPIRFMTGALGNTRPLLVSPSHRMLLTGWKAELHFGEAEVLVPAHHLVNGDTICAIQMEEVTYVHLLFERHEVIFAEGAATESLHPGDYLIGGDSDMRRELIELFPELDSAMGRAQWKSARSVARAREAMLLVA